MIAMDVDVALSEVPVNAMPLTDDGDFKSIEASVAYNAGGMALYWHFVTSAGVETTTQVTPTTGGTYDWAHAGQGMYTIEIPASGGASINNDTEGYGYFTGVATGVLPWRGPTICFRAAAINDSLCDAGTTGLLAPTTAGRTLDVTATGGAGIDWGNVENPTTTVNLSGTTIKTATDIATAVDAVDNFIDTEIAAIITTLGTPAGASLAADLVVIDDFVDALESRLTAARAGYLDNINNANLATVPAFPSNFASLGINASGHVSRVTLVDTVTTNTDMVTAAQIRAAVGLSSANLDTQLGAIDDLIDSEVATLITQTSAASIRSALGFASANFDTQIAAVKSDTAAILIDTAELQGDWTNGGRLDLLLDATLADTNELQTDWTNGGRLDLLLDSTLADTNELQTDWADGGRLDLILDARASQTSVNTIDDLIDTEIGTLQSTVSALFTTALTQSYRSAGSAPTMAQFAFETLAHLGDCSIAGTTKTLNNLAGSAAKTFTLNSASTPTSITETT